jgi:hypothetical protein
MSVTTSTGAKELSVPFPANGVIAVENASAGCPSPSYAVLETNYPKEKELESNCGNVFIKGTYTQSLTVIAQNDVIIAGSLTTEGGASGGQPTGNAALGLIAMQHARLYHPIKECEEPKELKSEPEVEVTEGSQTVKNVTPGSSVTVGAAISGNKIALGSTVTSLPNAKGEITISKSVEGAKGKLVKEKVKFITKIKEIVSCKNTEDTCPNSANATAGERPAEEFGGPLNGPVIDAAILSTKHSWGVDNFSCGGPLGEITIWGSIAENFRGRVTCCLTGGDYIKDYKYDERLKFDQPPDFLTPSSTEVTLSRVTAPPNGFGEG